LGRFLWLFESVRGETRRTEENGGPGQALQIHGEGNKHLLKITKGKKRKIVPEMKEPGGLRNHTRKGGVGGGISWGRGWDHGHQPWQTKLDEGGKRNRGGGGKPIFTNAPEKKSKLKRGKSSGGEYEEV